MAIPNGSNSNDGSSTRLESMYQTSGKPDPVGAEAHDAYDGVDEDEEEQKRIGEAAVQALKTLTRVGVMKWRIGNNWARACVGIRLDRFDDSTTINRLLWIANERELDRCGDRDEMCFDLDSDSYTTLMRNVVHAKVMWDDGEQR